MNHMNSAPACRCVHHKIVPILVILLGLAFLSANLGWLDASVVRYVWPSLIILIGLVKLGSGGCNCYMNAA